MQDRSGRAIVTVARRSAAAGAVQWRGGLRAEQRVRSANTGRSDAWREARSTVRAGHGAPVRHGHCA
eukprot:6197777-Pleurochrysis_carterae.AAC.1